MTAPRFPRKRLVAQAENLNENRELVSSAYDLGSLDRAAAELVIDNILQAADYFRSLPQLSHK